VGIACAGWRQGGDSGVAVGAEPLVTRLIHAIRGVFVKDFGFVKA